MECQELFSPPLARMQPAVPAAADVPGDLSPATLVQQLDAVPTLLEVLCEMTGMRTAAVVRVRHGRASVCAIKDGMDLGLKPGDRFELDMPSPNGALAISTPIVIEHASQDPRFRTPSGEAFTFESFLAAPIVIFGAEHFGHLCVIDRCPTRIGGLSVSTLRRFARLIAVQLEDQRRRQEVQDALRDERATAQLREQFIAILGHDLRNPLQAIIGTSELLGRHLRDTPDLAAMAGRIKINSKRMSSLIDDVLDFARGQLGGGIGLQFKAVDNLPNGLASVVEELQEGQPTRTILTNVSVARTVHCDIGRIQQLASNLISNALIHGDAWSPVKVTASADDQDWVLEVWNQGDPIPPENINKVFEPFWRHSTSAARPGLGLGLHICAQIVRAHGGRLSVNSNRETGTRFTARLPLRPLP